MREYIKNLVLENRQNDPKSSISVSAYFLLTQEGYAGLAGVTVGDYSGDEIMILQKGSTYSVAVVGYGSCSHCDMLQGICDYGNPTEQVIKDLDDYVSNIVENMKNFASKDDLMAFLTSEDVGKYSWAFNSSEFKEALPEIKAKLA